jgi:hypothetical protein
MTARPIDVASSSRPRDILVRQTTPLHLVTIPDFAPKKGQNLAILELWSELILSADMRLPV